MKVAVTGATGFVGRYLLPQLLEDGYQVRAWFRSEKTKTGLEDLDIDWVQGELDDAASTEALLKGSQAVIHAGLARPKGTFQVSGDSILSWAQTNLMGTLRLISQAKELGLERFVFVSTCAVHDKILQDRPLDETHPLWPHGHYGAHKAAIEKFIHSYGLGDKFTICSVRPTGIYGVAHPVERSKWFDLVRAVKRGEPVTVAKGGKEVHVADVAKALSSFLDLPAEKIRGEAFNCYDQYISEYMVAHLAKELCRSSSEISGESKSPKNQIVTEKIKELGVSFGGDWRLRSTVAELLERA